MNFNHNSRKHSLAYAKEPGIGKLVVSTLWRWGRSNPRSFIFLLQTIWNLKRAERKRKEKAKLLGAHLPTVMAISPIRRTRPIVLVQFPQDEYGEENICSAAGQASLHINSQGFVEPCPFVPVSCDNIRSGGLLEACRSKFLCSIRQNPELLKRKKYACALFEHLDDIKAIACRVK